MTNKELFIDPLVDQIRQLESMGFKPTGDMRVKGGKQLLDWTRFTSWKQEKIQLHYPSKDPGWCEISFWIHLVVDNHPYLLTAQDIGMLKNKNRRYMFPSVFKCIRAKSVIEKVFKDVLSSLDWFESKDKVQCLRMINSDDENVVIKPTKPIYAKVQALLQDESK